MTEAPEFAPVGISHAELVAGQARELAQLAHDQGVKRSAAESVVTALKDSQPKALNALRIEHIQELDARRAQLAKRWIPKLVAALSPWRKAPSREATSAVGQVVRDYSADGVFACGFAEPLTLTVAFAETMIAQLPSSVAIWANPSAWRDHGGYRGETNLPTLGHKAFEALANPIAVAEASRALESLETQFTTLTSAAASWTTDLAAAQADWEIFKSCKSFSGIVEALNDPARRKAQIALEAAATDARRQVIIAARGGDALARSMLGTAWDSIQRLGPELFGKLAP